MPELPALNLVINESNDVSTAPNSHEDRPPSPDAPPYSPITPVMSSSSLHERSPNHPDHLPSPVPQPPPLLPFSESENPDAIALRSAISILQIQRQQSLRDLKVLEQQKQVALADPEAFLAEVAAGNMKTSSSGKLVVGPKLDRPSRADAEDPQIDPHDDAEQPIQQESKFSDIPGPQNVIRAPPINWAKYHIVGEALDKLHEEQRARPTSGQPRRDEEGSRGPVHVIAAPYNPWTDKLSDPPLQTKHVSNERR